MISHACNYALSNRTGLMDSQPDCCAINAKQAAARLLAEHLFNVNPKPKVNWPKNCSIADLAQASI